MKNKLKISIVIPAFNTEVFIAECLDSCVNQSLDEVEIIVVNDGSTDNTSSVVNKYVENFNSKVKLFNVENNGPGTARNFGVSKALGEYISFVDSDDVISKDFCERMYNTAIENDADVVRCDYQRRDNFDDICLSNNIKSNSFENFIANNGNVIEKLSAESQLLIWHLPCTGIYRKSLFNRIGFEFPKGIIEDPVTKILFLESNKIVLIPLKLYFYRTHSSSITSEIAFEKREVALTRWYYILDYYESKRCLLDSGIIESFLYSSASYVVLINEIKSNSLKVIKENFDNCKYDKFIELYKKVDKDTTKIVRASGIKRFLYRKAIINFYEKRFVISKTCIIIVNLLARIKGIIRKKPDNKDKYYLN